MQKEEYINDLISRMDENSRTGDQNIFVRDAKIIYDRLKDLHEPVGFKEVEYPMNIDTNLYLRKDKRDILISQNELLLLVEKFAKINEMAKIQFKS